MDCTSSSQVKLPPTSDLVVGLITVDVVIGLPARNFAVRLASNNIVRSYLSAICFVNGLVSTNIIKRPSGHRGVTS